MNDYKIGQFAFMEFTLKSSKARSYSDPISGVYEIVDIDKNCIQIREQEIELIVQKARITKYEVREVPVKK
jgi:hypothetical protein